MAIINTYPFKKAPLSKDDEIIISDAQSNNPNFKTKSTSIDNIAAFVIARDGYIWTQDIATATWIIPHNLDKYPSATVVDSGRNVNIGDITYDSKNQITIRFSAPFSGEAYLN
tara:strand:+ start:623 stop:961 length:339 start_codon:yes stop_codon:yes gene_type:complete